MRIHRDRIVPVAAVAAVASAALCIVTFAPPAAAIGIGFDPDLQSVELGETAAVDIVFSDLGGEIVSAYDLDITYDAGVLDATGVVFTTALGEEAFFEVFNDFDVSAPGLVDLAQVSLLPDTVLAALQAGGQVTAATVLFEAVGVGTTDLAFSFDAFNDVKGRDGAVLPIVAGDGSVSVMRGPSPVPEPSGALLFGVGALLVGRRR